jgi:ABC-type nitrate/sulfonate/bicarbonate transport system substrate-binding protein
MTQDEVIAALREVVAANNQYTTWTVSTPHLVALVNLVIEQEREACAKIVEEHAKAYAKLEKNPATSAAWAACIDIHDSISERGDV